MISIDNNYHAVFINILRKLLIISKPIYYLLLLMSLLNDG